MAVYAIGDLQGCHDELRARFDPATDRLWLVGDLVNRGPGSLATLRTVRALGESCTTVLGNHDLHLLAVASGAGRGRKAGDTLDEVLAAPDRDELLAWLRTRPLLHHDAALGWTMVHAGLAPQWTLDEALACAREVEAALAAEPREFFAQMYGNRPDRWSTELAGHERLRFTVNCTTRLRYCGDDGRLLLEPKGPPESAPPGAIPWFRAPGRRTREARIVFGHWSALGWYAGDGVLSLDTGCVWGQRLTAVRLDAYPGARWPTAQDAVWTPCRGAAEIDAVGSAGE